METMGWSLPQPQKESDLTALGFNERQRGVLTSRTIMLDELDNALASLPAALTPRIVRKAIIERNILGKATRSGRTNSADMLIGLYGFDRKTKLFSAFQTFWEESPQSRPLLAVLMALCRDAVLRTSAKPILGTCIGGTVTKDQIYESLLAGFSAKYAETTLQSATRNTASSWRQSGHLKGRLKIIRTKVSGDAYSLAFAVYIAYLRGFRGQAILNSDWVRLLDFEPSELEACISQAHRQGLITSRNFGDVIELLPRPVQVRGGTD